MWSTTTMDIEFREPMIEFSQVIVSTKHYEDIFKDILMEEFSEQMDLGHRLREFLKFADTTDEAEKCQNMSDIFDELGFETSVSPGQDDHYLLEIINAIPEDLLYSYEFMQILFRYVPEEARATILVHHGDPLWLDLYRHLGKTINIVAGEPYFPEYYREKEFQRVNEKGDKAVAWVGDLGMEYENIGVLVPLNAKIITTIMEELDKPDSFQLSEDYKELAKSLLRKFLVQEGL